MLHIEQRYILLAGATLINFKQKNDNLYNFDCPFCPLEDRNNTKAYFFKADAGMRFWCHKCRGSYNIGTFLTLFSPNLHERFLLDKFGSPKRTFTRKPTVSKPKLAPIEKKESFKYMQPVSELPDAHFAKQYILSRRIPRDKHHLLYYTGDFAACVNEVFPDKYKNLKHDHRIVIPFYEKNKELIILQGRALRSAGVRYLTAKRDESLPLVYGMERFDPMKKVLVVEGPIDSLFLPNCIAVAGADLKSIAERVPDLKEVICIFDNEPRNVNILRAYEQAIQAGIKVLIWPNKIKTKDINDLIESDWTTDEILDMIEENSYSGLRATLEFGNWKKRCSNK